jgi:serine/threonine protein kinase
MTISTFATGAVFAGEFEIVEPLKSGGMGSVYVARQRSTGKLRALKLMLPQLVADADLRRRFEQEARIASLIKSDHVVEVVGAGVDEATGLPWLAMELLEGTDLDSAVEARGPMLLRDVRPILEQVCHALAAAHDAGIVHRDLKPENVFLAESKLAGGSPVVKVLDFGIAKIAALAATQSTGAMGSPVWMAPEQTERGVVQPTADVWAIGLIAFFLLTGKPFWLSAVASDSTVQQIMREVLFESIPPASERARRYGAAELLPAWFDAWFARCVVRDPSERLPNAAEAFALFERSCGDAASMPRVDGAPSTGSARILVGPSPTEGTAPTMFASAGAPSLANPSTAVARPRRRIVRPGFLVAAIAALGLGGAGYAFAIREPPAARPVVVQRTPGASTSLPPELASTNGAAWFTRVRAKCNPIEVELLVQTDPPARTKDGKGFAAACFALAGKLNRSRRYLDSMARRDRAWGAWAVFEVVHPVADAGDDASTGPVMRLVLEYWPENYMALYHAGMAEFATRQPDAARDHLTRFLSLYDKPDGFTTTAKRVLAELESGPQGAPDCTKPLAIDPEGRRIFPAACGKAR